MDITKETIKSVELDRWSKGIPHDPRSEEIVRALVEIDFLGFNDHFGWKVGGDGDNGESLMYELDVYFELKDKEKRTMKRLAFLALGGTLVFSIPLVAFIIGKPMASMGSTCTCLGVALGLSFISGLLFGETL